MVSIISSEGRSSRRSMLRALGAGGLATVAAAGLGQVASAVESDELPRVAAEWLGAWSSDDPPSAIAALYSPEGSYADIATGSTIMAPDIESYLRDFLAGLVRLNRYPRNMVAVDGFAVAEQLFWGASQFDSSGAEPGPEFQTYVVTVFQHDGQSLLSTTDYYDLETIRLQLDPRPYIPYGDCKSG